MADNDTDQDDKTEDASPERRDEYREKGQLAVSKELSGAAVLAGLIIGLGYWTPPAIIRLEKNLTQSFTNFSRNDFTVKTLTRILSSHWIDFLSIVVPLFLVILLISSFSTFLQTQFNWSWERLEPSIERMNPFSGLKRMVNIEALVELLKSLGKLGAVTLVAVLIIYAERQQFPGLMNLPYMSSWKYFSNIFYQLLWSVTFFMLAIAIGDYVFNFMNLEKQMRMTKQEVKEEAKQREVDPQMKARIKRMGREIANRKVLEKTKAATVIITNPTHYSIAIQYEIGMIAPKVVAKGIDFLALRMREIAEEADIPRVENRPLARALYDQVEEGQEIPVEMYKAVSEVIRYIFQIKGVRIPQKV